MELLIAAVVALVVGVAVLAHRPSDAELHEADRRAATRRRRQPRGTEAGARLAARLAGTGMHVNETTRKRLHGEHL